MMACAPHQAARFGHHENNHTEGGGWGVRRAQLWPTTKNSNLRAIEVFEEEVTSRKRDKWFMHRNRKRNMETRIKGWNNTRRVCSLQKK